MFSTLLSTIRYASSIRYASFAGQENISFTLTAIVVAMIVAAGVFSFVKNQ